ncbi:hypothetical protein ACUTAF_02055 [Pseudomonas sp. SP16.1]|uniref:hypothetical protein n=1 Tax=Pseudomonas sp. SP16.1 TaxID=3458854 RepID=UPI004046722A
MTAKVFQLAGNGLTPGLVNALDAMRREIWESIDKAADAGMPAGLIVGQLEFMKAAIIEAHFRQAEQEE